MMNRAFSPRHEMGAPVSWGFAPGWDQSRRWRFIVLAGLGRFEPRRMRKQTYS
jgi:hypothetical protein